MLSRCVAGFNTEKKSNQFYTQKIQPPKLEDMGALLKSKGGISMKTQEIIKALRSTPSRSKRTLLDKAADRLEQLQTENDALFRAAMDSRKESGLLNE